MNSSLFRLLGLALCLALLAACGPKLPPVYQGPQEIRDLKNLPQDLTAYLSKDSGQNILSPDEAEQNLAKWRQKFFTAWDMKKPSVAKKDVNSLLRRKARGWKDGKVQWQDAEWTAMRTNARMDKWPNMNRPGIMLRASDLREMPTHEARFSVPTPNPADQPFDLFQYSRLAPGLPVLICQKSADGRWHYLETPLAAGWVDAKDVAPVSRTFMNDWREASMGAIVRERVALGMDAGFADIGCVLPMPGENEVLVPVKGADGMAAKKRVQLAEGSVEAMPLTMTPANVARLGNLMMGQNYGWGGMLELRDCSAMTRDLMTPFGIWLPRNSQAQARAGIEQFPLTPLEGYKAKEKEVLRFGVPFASLLTLKGHVVLYIGPYKGRPAIMHDLWGIRVDEPEGEDDRLIIGRIVVTTMTPGSELPTLHNNSTIGDRFHTLTVLGGSPR